MQVIRVQTGYTNNCNTSFGYKFPEYIPGRLKENGYKMLEGNRDAAYDEYIKAIKNFIEKRFDATSIVKKYLKELEELGCKDALGPVWRKFEVPIVRKKTKKVVTDSSSWLDKILILGPTTKEITTITEGYDYANINPELLLKRYSTAKKIKMYIYTNELRDRSEEHFDELTSGVTPVFEMNEDGYMCFDTAEGIEDIGKKIDQYLAENIEKEIEKIISNQRKSFEQRRLEQLEIERRERVKKDLASLGFQPRDLY